MSDVGILLITDIVLTAGADDEATHMVYDFGTQHFECSIVVYGLQLPAGSGRLRSSGHYETVGLFPIGRRCDRASGGGDVS